MRNAKCKMLAALAPTKSSECRYGTLSRRDVSHPFSFNLHFPFLILTFSIATRASAAALRVFCTCTIGSRALLRSKSFVVATRCGQGRYRSSRRATLHQHRPTALRIARRYLRRARQRIPIRSDHRAGRRWHTPRLAGRVSHRPVLRQNAMNLLPACN
jgi:hypothetical protein